MFVDQRLESFEIELILILLMEGVYIGTCRRVGYLRTKNEKDPAVDEEILANFLMLDKTLESMASKKADYPLKNL